MNNETNWPMILIGIGSFIFAVGEIWGALRNKNDSNGAPVRDTFSQWYINLPPWLQHLISWGNGAVCSHLWRWTIATATVASFGSKSTGGE